MAARKGRTRPRSWSGGWLGLGWVATALFFAFIGLPFAALFVRGLPREGFWSSLAAHTVLEALRLSFITSAITLGVAVVVGTPMAYLLARRRFPGSAAIDACIELPVVLPPVVAGLGMLMAFGRVGLLGSTFEFLGFSIPFTMAAVVFAQLFVSAPFYVRAAKIGFEAVDPGLEEISETLGESPARTFLRVSLPLASRALAGGLALCWARAISEFGATLIFAGNLPGRTQTMPLAIMSALETDLSAALALAIVLAVISLGVLLAVRLALGRTWGPAP